MASGMGAITLIYRKNIIKVYGTLFWSLIQNPTFGITSKNAHY